MPKPVIIVVSTPDGAVFAKYPRDTFEAAQKTLLKLDNIYDASYRFDIKRGRKTEAVTR